MRPNYKKIDKIDLPKQLFICSGERSKDKYYIYFKDIQNKDMILGAISNMEDYFIQILSDTKDELYQSTVKILKSSERAEKKPRIDIEGHTKLLCKRHKIKIDSGVVEYIQSHNDEWLDVLFENFASKAKIIEMYPKYKNKPQLVSSRLTVLTRKKPESRIKLSPMVAMYNLKVLKEEGII